MDVDPGSLSAPMSSDVDTLDPRTVVPTRYWHALEDGRVQCDLCPRFCKMHEGQRGLCFVRANHQGAIVLTTYGRSSGFCVDPIEKKPLNHFLPGTPVLSFGTAGCNLACQFCQNWDISKSREMDTLMDQAGPETIARAARQLGCKSVAFTYNDPVIFMEYAIDVAKACREHGVKSVAVTAGYMTDAPRREFYQYMDAANVDLKAFTEDFYWRITSAHLAPVLETLVYLKHETQVWFELTTLHHPRPQRLGPGAHRDGEVGGVAPGARRPDALLGVSSGLAHARRAADAGRHAHARAPHRHGPRRALRLYRQRP